MVRTAWSQLGSPFTGQRALHSFQRHLPFIWSTFTAPVTVHIFELDRKHLVEPVQDLAPSSRLWQQLESNFLNEVIPLCTDSIYSLY